MTAMAVLPVYVGVVRHWQSKDFHVCFADTACLCENVTVIGCQVSFGTDFAAMTGLSDDICYGILVCRTCCKLCAGICGVKSSVT